jgi:type VI secretion system protein ImpC
MVRDKIGSFMEASDLQIWLNKWITSYVVDGGDEAVKAKQPLKDARVEVTDIEGDPGNYRAVFHLRPHFQLEGLTASLRLVSTMKQKG